MFDKSTLLESTTLKMPFGKYKDVLICDLPIFYLEWFLKKNNEFPKGKLGDTMSIVYQVKLNGLDNILEELKSK